jgi:hypothetical protein
VVALIPAAGMMVILVVVVGFITAGQGEGDDPEEEDHAEYIDDVSGRAFHTTGFVYRIGKILPLTDTTESRI